MSRVIKQNIQPIIIAALAAMVLILIYKNDIRTAIFPHQETRQDQVLKRMSKSGQTVRLVDVESLAEGDWRMFCIVGPDINPANILPREASISSQRLKRNALDRLTKRGEMVFVQIDSQGLPSLRVRPHDIDIVLHGSHKCVQAGKSITFLPVGARDFSFYR